MSTNATANETSPATSVLAFFNVTTELVHLSPEPTVEKADSLPIIIALICIFILLATCLIFVTLCKPAALDQSFHGPHECMPYHPEDASEPQLRFWKRLGSLRQSVRSVKRSRPTSHHTRESCSRKAPVSHDWSIMESTEM
uniref:Chromosome 10 open reading frame 105 n=1 Tax=Varanus komodoensis TaxID=61221 RepID=A0A8D2KSZ0_VARKO